MSDQEPKGHASDSSTDAKPRDPSVQQMADGAQQLAAGAKRFFDDRVAPAVGQAADAVRQSADQSDQLGPWIARAPWILPPAAFLALLSLFLPFATGFGWSVNYFSDQAAGEGVFLLLLFVAVIGTAVAALVTRTRATHLAAGVAGVLAGMLGGIDGFGTMTNIPDGMWVGFGSILLLLLSLVVLAAGVLTLLRSQRLDGAA